MHRQRNTLRGTVPFDQGLQRMEETPTHPRKVEELSAAELGALAHLYRGEIYRSTVWRTRLDTTTN